MAQIIPRARAFWEITNPGSVWVGRGFWPDCDATRWRKTRPQSHPSSLQAPRPPPQRGSLCARRSDLFAANSSYPDHICSWGPAGPAEVNPRSGAPTAIQRESLELSRTNGSRVHFFSAFANSLSRPTFHLGFFFFFCLCDVVPSVFLEGYTISGFKSA